MKSLKDKVVVVTGGTRGIGLATAMKLEEKGAIVYACARHEVELPCSIRYLKLDVTCKAECESAVKQIIKDQGRIDGLVADAGITRDALIGKMTDEMFDEVLNTNVKGVFNIIKAVHPYMEEQKKGAIVAVSSIVAVYGNIGQINYASSKAAVIGMCKSCAKEFARKGQNIRVNAICPGYIMTDMLKTVPEDLLKKFANQTMLKRLGEPEEIANIISFLISDVSSYITGSVIEANGGMRL